MNKTSLLLKGVAISFIGTALLSACAKFTPQDFHVDQPQAVIDQETLNGYGNLKTYIDNSAQPNFRLGASLSFEDVINNSLLYRLVQQNFDEVNIGSGLKHIDFVQGDGNLAMGRFQQFLDLNESTGLAVHAGHLVWHEQQQSTYLNSLIADIVIPGVSGSDVIADFEGDELGDSYPMSNGGSSEIQMDPTGDSGKTLNIKGAQTFPQFEVTLPEGRTLGDYVSVTIDFKGAGCCGLWGAGMRLAITESIGYIDPNSALLNHGYGGPGGGFGVGDGQWGRGKIVLPLSAMQLSSAQKALTSFVLTVGSGTGSADYLMDNVTMQWEIPGETIVKTPEEKKEIIRGELDKWIKGVAELGKDKVTSWNVVHQPIDEGNPTELRTGVGIDPMPANTFYWQDYLGKDYAAIAIQMVKQYSNADDKIFISETNLAANPDKIQGLVDLINHTEAQGAQVNGIATELELTTGSDKSKIENMLQALAATGKLIKLSFRVDVGNADQLPQQADMYKYVVETYYTLIPATQRAGITFSSPVDPDINPGSGLWTSENPNNHLRKSSYAGVVEALEAIK